MRFMMLMIPKGYETAEPGTMPDAEAVAAMMKYNESLQKAGVLLALDGLHPPSMGARVSFPGGKPKVTDGPFAEAKEVLGGYWMIQVKSKEEAIEWASRCPAVGQRGDRDPPGPGARGLPGRCPGGRGRVRRDAGGDPSKLARRRSVTHRLHRVAMTADATMSIGQAHDDHPTPIAPSTRSGGSSPPGSSPASRAWCATSAWPRSWRRTRWSPRSSSGRESGVPDNPGAWLMATAKHRAIDQLRRDKLLERKHEELGRELEAQQETAVRRSRRRARRRHRRRPAAPDVHRLPSGALDRGARRADPAPARRPDHRRDRARLPRARSRPSPSASCAPSGRSPRRTCPSRCRAAPSSPRASSSVLEVIYLDLQRGLLGHRRRRLDAPGAVRGRAAPRPHPGRARAAASRRCTAWSR